MKNLLLLGIFLTLIQNSVHACSVCFGDPSAQANIAMRQGIVAMLVVLVFVLGAFAAFFISIARRSKLQQAV